MPMQVLGAAGAQRSRREHVTGTRFTSSSTRTQCFSPRSVSGSNKSSPTRKAKRIDAAEQLKLFEVVKAELRGHAQAAERVGLSETGFAIYGLLVEPAVGGASKAAEPRAQYGNAPVDEAQKDLAALLIEH